MTDTRERRRVDTVLSRREGRVGFSYAPLRVYTTSSGSLLCTTLQWFLCVVVWVELPNTHARAAEGLRKTFGEQLLTTEEYHEIRKRKKVMMELEQPKNCANKKAEEAAARERSLPEEAYQ